MSTASDALIEKIDILRKNLMNSRSNLVRKSFVFNRKLLIEHIDSEFQYLTQWRESILMTEELIQSAAVVSKATEELKSSVAALPEPVSAPTHGIVTHYSLPGKPPIVHFYAEPEWDRKDATNARLRLLRSDKKNQREELRDPSGVLTAHAVEILPWNDGE